jgi:hypothetical protein
MLMNNLMVAASGLGPVTREWVELVGTQPMSNARWHSAGVRPSNRPRRRLGAAAAYVARGAASGLRGWLDAATAAGTSALVESLVVPGDGDGPAMAGQARAREIAVNAVLPTLAAWAARDHDGASSRRLAAAYEAFPSLSANTITREARRLSGGRSPAGARKQQGLMHLYRRGVAASPPLGQIKDAGNAKHGA